LPGPIVNQQDGRWPDRLRDLVVSVGHLTDMPDIDPTAIPDAFELLLEYLLVVIKAAVDPGRLNEGAIVDQGRRVNCGCHFLSPNVRSININNPLWSSSKWQS